MDQSTLFVGHFSYTTRSRKSLHIHWNHLPPPTTWPQPLTSTCAHNKQSSSQEWGVKGATPTQTNIHDSPTTHKYIHTHSETHFPVRMLKTRDQKLSIVFFLFYLTDHYITWLKAHILQANTFINMENRQTSGTDCWLWSYSLRNTATLLLWKASTF